jgi:hypothetical protein
MKWKSGNSKESEGDCIIPIMLEGSDVKVGEIALKIKIDRPSLRKILGNFNSKKSRLENSTNER